MKKHTASLFVLSSVLACLCIPAAVNAEPIVPDYIIASSILNEAGYDHSPACLQDNDLSTAWMEGDDGTGLWEYLDFGIPEGTELTGGVIYPGFYVGEDLFYKNNAPTRLYISSGGQGMYLDVSEYAETYHPDFNGYHFVLEEPLMSDGTVRVTILGVREGWKYNDTCISELWFEDEYDPFLDPDGLGGDGPEPDEFYGTQDPEFLDLSEAEPLADFASTLYKLHCHFAQAQSISLKHSSLYSYSRAYMLNWYQLTSADPRVFYDGQSNCAYDTDLKDIVDELFEGASPDSDLHTFRELFALSSSDGLVRMQSTGEFGTGGNFYFDSPYTAETSGSRTLIAGDVMEFSAAERDYIPVMEYRAYFIQDPVDPSVFRFDELVTGNW